MVIIFEWPPSSELPLLNCHYFQNCHPERSEGSASAVAFAVAVTLVFLSVIPVGNLLLLLSFVVAFDFLVVIPQRSEGTRFLLVAPQMPTSSTTRRGTASAVPKHLSGNGASAPEVRLTQPQGNTPRKL